MHYGTLVDKMITPSAKLLDAIELFNDRRTFCERIGLDETLLSKLLKQERGAPASVMEKICRHFNWSLSDAWDIVDGEEKD